MKQIEKFTYHAAVYTVAITVIFYLFSFISGLENADMTVKMAAESLAEETNAEVVCVIGRKMVLYRESENHKKIEL